MDANVQTALREAGIEPLIGGESVLVLEFERDARGTVVPAGETVTVRQMERTARVQLAPCSALYVGNAKPPSFSAEPPHEYMPFFVTMELCSALFCHEFPPLSDEDFERIYSELARRPDGKSGHLLLSYLRATARLCLALRDTSAAELEAVARRLARSARTFRMHFASTNYFEHALEPLIHGSDVEDTHDHH